MVKLGHSTKNGSLITIMAKSGHYDVIVTIYEKFVNSYNSWKNSFWDIKSTKLSTLNTKMMISDDESVIITIYEIRKIYEIGRYLDKINIFRNLIKTTTETDLFWLTQTLLLLKM